LKAKNTEKKENPVDYPPHPQKMAGSAKKMVSSDTLQIMQFNHTGRKIFLAKSSEKM